MILPMSVMPATKSPAASGRSAASKARSGGEMAEDLVVADLAQDGVELCGAGHGDSPDEHARRPVTSTSP